MQSIRNNLKISVLFLVLLVAGLISCRKDISQVEPENPSTGELKVSQTFDWKTTKNYEITLTGNVNGLISVNNAQDIPYQKVYLVAFQPYVMKITLPAYETSVKLKFNGKEASLPLSGSALSYQFN